MVHKIQLPSRTQKQEQQAEEVPESPSQEQENQRLNSSADGSHLDDIIIEEDVGEGAEESQNNANNGLNPDGTMTREAFFIAFKGAFNISGAVTGLKSLKIEEEESAQLAADAIYDIALEVSYFRFLIQPSNVWIQRSIAIGTFVVPKVVMIRLELDAKKAEKMKDVTPEKKEKEPEQYEDPLKDFPKDA